MYAFKKEASASILLTNSVSILHKYFIVSRKKMTYTVSMENKTTSFGNYLNEIRTSKEVNLKVYELAGKAKVHPTYITLIEKHGRIPSEEIFKRINAALGENLTLKRLYENLSSGKKSILTSSVDGEQSRRDILFDALHDDIVNPSLTPRIVGVNNPEYPAYIKNLVKELISEHIPFAANNEKLIDKIANDFTKAYRDHENALALLHKNIDRFVNLLTWTEPSDRKLKPTIKLTPIEPK